MTEQKPSIILYGTEAEMYILNKQKMLSKAIEERTTLDNLNLKAASQLKEIKHMHSLTYKAQIAILALNKNYLKLDFPEKGDVGMDNFIYNRDPLDMINIAIGDLISKVDSLTDFKYKADRHEVQRILKENTIFGVDRSDLF